MNQCLAIHNADLQAGTAITAMSLDGQPLSSHVSIQSIANSENCKAPNNDQNVITDTGLHYYTVDTSSEFGL